MSDYDLDIMRLARDGYCCAQIIVQMALDLQGTTNPGLIRAMTGLCHGEMGTPGVCGAYGGAACLIAYYGGKGTAVQAMHERLPLMLGELAEWFRQYTTERFHGSDCIDIINDGEPDQSICGNLVGECYGKVLVILTENGIDPTVLNDDG